MWRAKACGPDNLAMQVLATVVSRPRKTRAVLDAGSKALTSDLFGFADHGLILTLPGGRIVSFSDEHGVVDPDEGAGPGPGVGAPVGIVPTLICAVSNLFDRTLFYRSDSVTRVLPIAPRGAVC